MAPPSRTQNMACGSKPLALSLPCRACLALYSHASPGPGRRLQGNFGRHDAAVLFSFSVRVEMPPPAARTPNIIVTYLDELNPTHTTTAP